MSCACVIPHSIGSNQSIVYAIVFFFCFFLRIWQFSNAPKQPQGRSRYFPFSSSYSYVFYLYLGCAISWEIVNANLSPSCYCSIAFFNLISSFEWNTIACCWAGDYYFRRLINPSIKKEVIKKEKLDVPSNSLVWRFSFLICILPDCFNAFGHGHVDNYGDEGHWVWRVGYKDPHHSSNRLFRQAPDCRRESVRHSWH